MLLSPGLLTSSFMKCMETVKTLTTTKLDCSLCFTGFSLDGETIFTGSSDGVVRTLSARTGGQIKEQKGEHVKVPSVLVVNRQGATAFSVAQGALLGYVWSLSTGGPTASVESWGAISSAVFSNKGTALLIIERNKAILYDLTKRTIALHERLSLQTFKGHSWPITSVVFSLDDKRILTGSYEEIFLWDVKTGCMVMKVEGIVDTQISVLACSPRCTTIFVGYQDGQGFLFECITKQKLLTLNASKKRSVEAVTFNSEKEVILGIKGDDRVYVWVSALDQYYETVKVPSYTIHSLLFSPDGKNLLLGLKDGTIYVWPYTHEILSSPRISLEIFLTRSV